MLEKDIKQLLEQVKNEELSIDEATSVLKELPYTVDDYDQIITGDLGEIGSNALYDLLSLEGYDISARHADCGLLIFDREKEDVHAGGSGCGCRKSGSTPRTPEPKNRK